MTSILPGFCGFLAANRLKGCPKKAKRSDQMDIIIALLGALRLVKKTISGNLQAIDTQPAAVV